jgi:hypothetical protein
MKEEIKMDDCFYIDSQGELRIEEDPGSPQTKRRSNYVTRELDFENME